MQQICNSFMEEIYDNIEVSIIDDHTAKSIWLGDPTKRPSDIEFSLRLVLERLSIENEEEEFAKKFDVPLGWRFYRDEKSNQGDWINHFEYSEFQRNDSKYLWVEKEMITSCLPSIELVENTNKKFRSVLRGVLLNRTHNKSRDLKCIRSG